MSTQYLFNRDWSVAFGKPGQPFKEYKSDPNNHDQNLRVTFEIEKNIASVSNKSKVKVYNLDNQSIKNYQKGNLILLKAGYKNLVKPILLGTITRTQTKREHSDVYTEFEVGEGEPVLANAIFNQTYPKGTTAFQIISDLANALEYNKDKISIGTAIGIQTFVIQRNFVAHGPAKNSLDKICALIDLKWSIQNGVLEIFPRNAHIGDRAIVISEKTGLINTPSSNQISTQFTTLLNPNIIPGRLVLLESQLINGYFRINRAKYHGDSHGDKWQVECECVKINATQTYPTGVGSFLKSGVK